VHGSALQGTKSAEGFDHIQIAVEVKAGMESKLLRPSRALSQLHPSDCHYFNHCNPGFPLFMKMDICETFPIFRAIKYCHQFILCNIPSDFALRGRAIVESCRRIHFQFDLIRD
jgi:hypothetical protein